MQFNCLFAKSSLAIAGAVTAIGLAADVSQASSFVGRYSFTNGSTSGAVTGRPVVFSRFTSNGVHGTPLDVAGTAHDRFIGSRWTTGSSKNPSQYFQFAANPLGNRTTFNSFGFNSWSYGSLRKGLGPRHWMLKASLDGGRNFFEVLSGGLGVQDTINRRFHNSRLTNVTQQVVFRLYGFNAPTSHNFWNVDDVHLGGISAIPTPAALPAILGFGMQLWRKRKLQAAEE
jgi:hypothetical protein